MLLNAIYLLDDVNPEISLLVLKQGNDVVEEDVEMLVSVSEGNDERQFRLGFAVARSPLSSLHHAAAVSRLHCLLRYERHVWFII